MVQAIMNTPNTSAEKPNPLYCGLWAVVALLHGVVGLSTFLSPLPALLAIGCALVALHRGRGLDKENPWRLVAWSGVALGLAGMVMGFFVWPHLINP